MKKIIALSVIILLGSRFGFSQTNNCEFIKKVTVTPDIMYEGVHGVKVEYSYDFSEIKSKLKVDSTKVYPKFKTAISFKTTDGNVKATKEYGLIQDIDNNLVYPQTFLDNLASFPKDKVSCFIPYTAVDLSEGEHILSADIVLTGTDTKNNNYYQDVQKQNISIHKKKQYKITFNIDYLTVASVNAKGNPWDYAIFRTDAPDVGVNFKMADIKVWSQHVNDTYTFAMGPTSKNIYFNISQGDNVKMEVVDVDVMFDDYIGEFNILPSDKDIGSVHIIDQPKGLITGCLLNWKIE